MSFFKKLKDRMFKSSSKIEEGLDAIVEEGGVEEAPTDLTPEPSGEVRTRDHSSEVVTEQPTVAAPASVP